MAGSNIFMQIIGGTGPVVGEGLLQGWQGSIELQSFDFEMEYVGSAQTLGGAMSRLGPGAMAAMLGFSKGGRVEFQELSVTKRFDVASAQLHMLCDYDLPIASATITVLHIKQSGRAIHQPGFVLGAFGGKVTSVDLKASESGTAGAELVETVKFRFAAIEMTYLKTLGKDNLPTAPFFYKQPFYGQVT